MFKLSCFSFNTVIIYHNYPQDVTLLGGWIRDGDRVRGKVCGHKSNKNFSRSAASIDEAYQQNNAIINGDGGAISLTKEISQLVADYEATSGSKDIKKE